VQRIDADNIYYFDLGEQKYLTFTDMKYNAVPIEDKSRAPWLNDMHLCGILLAKLLATNCDFVISDES